jgi:hypothetical protein
VLPILIRLPRFDTNSPTCVVSRGRAELKLGAWSVAKFELDIRFYLTNNLNLVHNLQIEVTYGRLHKVARIFNFASSSSQTLSYAFASEIQEVSHSAYFV